MEQMNCILLVDDDAISSFIAEGVIKKMDLTKNVRKSANGEEALLYLTKYFCSFEQNNLFPELILLDNNMPEMNGQEFMESLQQISVDTKTKVNVIVLSGSDNPADREKMEKLGVKGYITKPLTAEKLHAAIANC